MTRTAPLAKCAIAVALARKGLRAFVISGNLGEPDTRARYGATAAYARSKLANVMHTFALARRMSGTGISVNCLHPGVVATNLLPRWLRVIKPLFTRVVFDAERGARTGIYLALDLSVAGISGRYFDEYQLPRAASPLANDIELQESLWNMSAEWTGAPQ